MYVFSNQSVLTLSTLKGLKSLYFFSKPSPPKVVLTTTGMVVVVKTCRKKVMSLAFNVLKCNNVLSQQRLSFLLAMAVGLHHPLVVVELLLRPLDQRI